MNTLGKRMAVAATAAALMLVPLSASAVGGLQGPVFKLDAAPNGDVLVADASSGITILKDGRITKTIAVPGATSVDAIGSKSFWVTTAGEDTESDSGQALWRVSNGKARMIANLFELEALDPDGDGVDSNPYDVAALGGDAALVVDAGGNSLHRIDNEGHAELVATFPVELLSTANFNDICVDLGPFGPPCPIPAPAIPGQSVPTSVVVGPDGDYWVGELKGFPAPTNQSGVWRIDAGATDVQCGVDPGVREGARRLHLDRRPDHRARRHAVRLGVRRGIVGSSGDLRQRRRRHAERLRPRLARLRRRGRLGVPEHTSVAFDKAGTPWVTANALVEGGAEVFPLN